MEVIQTLHMNQGSGKTSYAQNCTPQKEVISQGQRILEEAVRECLSKTVPESLGIADLGCGPGPNSSMVISQIINTISRSKLGAVMSEIRVSFNDVPSNDFTHLLASLPELYNKFQQENGVDPDRCFLSVVPGSFYGRLFPNKSLHFVHSSSSLHWLSQVPTGLKGNNGEQVNKGNVYISQTSSDSVAKAYLSQFQEDFSAFLKFRAEEIVAGGGMVLSFMGQIPTKQGSPEWELLGHALMSMTSEGLVEKEKIDSFNVPYYNPSMDEVRSIIEEEGSFIITQLESFDVEWVEDCSNGLMLALFVRATIESMLESHFGSDIMDELFARYAKLFDEYLSHDGTKFVNFLLSVTKK